MKLYTEEQVKEAIDTASKVILYYSNDIKYRKTPEDILNRLTPIELPVDEDIYSVLRGKKMFDRDWGFIEGAKWMRDKILNK